jgi:hypothetical protein
MDNDKAILKATFARIDPIAMAIAAGSVMALGLFAASAILLIKGMVFGGAVGPHLKILGAYLPGYQMSWLGAVIGSAYFWLIGAALGWVLAVLSNFAHHIYIALIVVRIMWWKNMAN